MVRTLLCAVLWFVTACGTASPASDLPFAPAGPGAAPDPAKPGPYPVGVRTYVLEDPSQVGPSGAPRRLEFEVWYPAAESARGQPGASYDIRELFTEEQRSLPGAAKLPILETSAVRDAPARGGEGPFPLVVFSHGHGAVRWQSTFYTVNLASHGYVVAAPDHVGDTLRDTARNALDATLVAFEYRPRDVSFLLDLFESLPANHALSGLVDASRVGVTGHSFGALTSLRVAAQDPRVRAIVPQAPASADIALVGFPTGFRLGIPAMIQAAHGDRTLPWGENVPSTWDRLSAPRALLDITRGGHFTFSDLCRFDLGPFVGEFGFTDLADAVTDGCDAAQPPAQVTQPLMNHFAIGFFNWVLRDSPGSRALLDQSRADALAPGEAALTLDLGN